MTAPLLDLIATVCRRQGVEPFLVGGPVRDRLLGRTSNDWDFVCAHAQRVARAVARKLARKLITLDEQHRIYRIVHPPLTLDFAELQGKTIEQDLARRDFTINAIASPLTREALVDPFHGQKDLRRKRLRAVSRMAFREDPLRLLRAFRFAAQLGLTIEARTLGWITAASREFRISTHGSRNTLGSRDVPVGSQGMKAVSAERVREELLRLLSQPHAAPELSRMDRCGLLTAIFPELEAGRRVALSYYGKGGVVKHHLQSVKNVEELLDRLERASEAGSPQGLGFIKDLKVLVQVVDYVRQPLGGYPRSAFLKLAALLHDAGKPATAQMMDGRLRFFGHEDVGAGIAKKTLEQLRFSRQEGSLIRSWVQNHMRAGNLAAAPKLTDKARARFFRDLGVEGVGMLLVSLGDHLCYLARSLWGKGKDPMENTARRLLEGYYIQRETVLPPKVVDGHVLMKSLRLKPGPLIGRLLEAVHDAQAEGRVRTAEEAIAFAKSKIKRIKVQAV